MRYLITGMSGTLGTALSDRLTKDGHECVGWAHMDPLVIDEPYDGAIHLAGKELLRPLKMCGLSEFDREFHPVIMLVELLAAAANGKIVNGGNIVVMSSVAAVCGVPGMSLYSAAKGAMESMVRSAAIELSTKRIRVNAVRAAGFSGAMNDRITKIIGIDGAKKYEEKHPLGMGDPQSVVHAIMFLLENEWSTGSIVTLDGGFSTQ